MLLFIPLALGQSIPNEVLKSISFQDVKLDIVPCVTKGFINSQRNPLKISGEIAGRNLIKEILVDRKCQDEFVAMQDRDIFHLNNSNFFQGLKQIKNDLSLNAVTMPSKLNCNSNESHVKMTAVIFRSDFVRQYVWQIGNEYCLCSALKRDLGKAYQYCLTDKIMVNEILE